MNEETVHISNLVVLIYLCIYISMYLYIYLTIYLSIYLSIYRSIYLNLAVNGVLKRLNLWIFISFTCFLVSFPGFVAFSLPFPLHFCRSSLAPETMCKLKLVSDDGTARPVKASSWWAGLQWRCGCSWKIARGERWKLAELSEHDGSRKTTTSNIAKSSACFIFPCAASSKHSVMMIRLFG